MSAKEIICIVCPTGCILTIEATADVESGYTVTNTSCKKGIVYGIEEMTDPRRHICSTVIIEGARLRRLPVRTSKPIPKDIIFDCMKEINKVRLKSPIKMGDVVLANVLGTDTDIVASRSL